MNEIFETFDLNLNARNLIISVSIVNQRLGKMTTLDDKTEVSEAMEKKMRMLKNKTEVSVDICDITETAFLFSEVLALTVSVSDGRFYITMSDVVTDTGIR
jgi:hypothetical protein